MHSIVDSRISVHFLTDFVVTILSRNGIFHYIYKTIIKALWLLIFAKFIRGKEEVSINNRPYRYQLDFYTNGKSNRETIKAVEFLPLDTKEQKKQKKTIINKIKTDLEIKMRTYKTKNSSKLLLTTV